MSRAGSSLVRKRVYRFSILGLLLIAVFTCGLYLLDQHLHRKFDNIATVNEAGYRGRLVGPKMPGERRIFLLGGSTALGYGVYPDQTIPAYLEQVLNAQAGAAARYSVVNLGFNNTGAAAFVPDLQSYSSLEPDVVILYTGTGDLKVNPFLGRHDSVVFRLTGYYPIVPLVITEKAKLIRYHSWGRWSQYKTVYRAGKATQSAQRNSSQPSLTQPDWIHYCGEVKKAIGFALAQRRQVIVVAEPYVSALHVDQQKALRKMVETEFRAEQGVTYLDFGLVLSGADEGFTTDGAHLSAEGNRLIAEKLAPYIQRLR